MDSSEKVNSMTNSKLDLRPNNTDLAPNMSRFKIGFSRKEINPPLGIRTGNWGAAKSQVSTVFLKSLLRRYGRLGYAHILQYFVPRLERLGVSSEVIRQLFVDKPKTLFDNSKGVMNYASITSR